LHRNCGACPTTGEILYLTHLFRSPNRCPSTNQVDPLFLPYESPPSSLARRPYSRLVYLCKEKNIGGDRPTKPGDPTGRARAH
jgi:hypothetical protein